MSNYNINILLFIFVASQIGLPATCSKSFLLQPKQAKLIYEMGEPSGICYSSITDSLWIISDSDEYIFESDFNGNIITSWKLPKHVHKDVESVSCNDKDKILYIVEEGRMRLSSFTLPQKEIENSFLFKDDEYQLILLKQVNITYTVSLNKVLL